MIMPFDCTCVFSPQLLSYSSIEIFCWIKCTYYSKGGSIANWINNSEREKKTCNHKTKTKPVKHNNEGENLYSTNRYSMFFYLWVRLRLNPRKRVRDKRKKTLESQNTAISKYIKLGLCSILEWVNVEFFCGTQLQVSNIKRYIPKFDTVLLHWNWSSLRRKY